MALTGQEWATVASLATAAGTFVLAVSTFSSVRSSNRTARAAERSLLAGLRPVLSQSRVDDPIQKVGFTDDHLVQLGGGRATAEVGDEAIYLTIGLRNVGSGLAVLDRWRLVLDRPAGPTIEMPDTSDFRRLTRDIYVAQGDIGFWQGAIRERSDPLWEPTAASIRERRPISVLLLYADHEGGQRTISLFTLRPIEDGGWMPSVARHWNLDRDDPR